MKRIGLLLFVSLLSIESYSQTYATDFTASNCNGSSYNLFSELDAGKIIVIGWTMPCATCAGPLLEVHNAILNYAISNPGVVEYWVTDDYANTSCSSVAGWCATYGITNATYFSSSTIDMNDYGGSGMPKVVVVGCSNHKIYYNKNDNPDGQAVSDAIAEALNDLANSCQLDISDIKDTDFEFTAFPNPTKSILNIEFKNRPQEHFLIELYTIRGEMLQQISLDKSSLEIQQLQLSTSDLPEGIYLLNLTGETSSATIKIQVEN